MGLGAPGLPRCRPRREGRSPVLASLSLSVSVFSTFLSTQERFPGGLWATQDCFVRESGGTHKLRPCPQARAAV